MGLANKSFRNLKTGETIKVLDNFGDTVILENKNRITMSELMDSNKYEEQIDPNAFLNNNSAFSNLTEKIKEIPTENMVDESVKIKSDDNFSPDTNESAIVQTSLEAEKAELAKKYGVDSNSSNDVNKQNKAFEDILNPDKKDNTNNKSSLNSDVDLTVNADRPKQNVVEDPIITMFKNAKRIKDFKFSIDIDEKIPRFDFIEMMEDSYNTSIIEFLASDITNNILQNPNDIKEIIKKEIEKKVYPNSKKDTKKSVNNNTKKTAKERIEIVSEMDDIKSIEKFIKGEKAKSVLKASDKRINELKEKEDKDD